MPRPYGWIRGEGTVKNQRWGLGSAMDVPVVPRPSNQYGQSLAHRQDAAHRNANSLKPISIAGLGTITAPCPGSPGCPGYAETGVIDSAPDVQQQLADIWDYMFTNAPVQYDAAGGDFPTPNPPKVIGGSALLLGIGGIVALILISRR